MDEVDLGTGEGQSVIGKSELTDARVQSWAPPSAAHRAAHAMTPPPVLYGM